MIKRLDKKAKSSPKGHEKIFHHNFFPKNRRGENILTENLLFIILNFVFLTVLILFLVSKVGNAAVLEEKYSKQIAMIIDSSRPVMTVAIDMQDAMEEKEEGVLENNIVIINENVVTVKLREEGGGYSYSFFNDVAVSSYFDSTKNKFIINIDRK